MKRISLAFTLLIASLAHAQVATYSFDADTTRNADGTYTCYVRADGIEHYLNGPVGTGRFTAFCDYAVGVKPFGGIITAISDENFNGNPCNVFLAVNHSGSATPDPESNDTWDVLGANLAADPREPCEMPTTSGKLFRITVRPTNASNTVTLALTNGGGHVWDPNGPYAAPLLLTCELVKEPVSYGRNVITLRAGLPVATHTATWAAVKAIYR